MNKNIKEYLVIGGFMLIPTIYMILIILYWKYDW